MLDDTEDVWAQLTREERERDVRHNAGLLEEIRLSGDGMVASDIHIPLTNWEMFGQLLRDADRKRLDGWLAIPGDLLHQDSTSRHDQKQKTAGFEHEKTRANFWVKRALMTFGVVAVSRGNHDENFTRKLEYGISFRSALRMILHDLTEDEFRRIKICENDHIMVDTDEGPWRLCHTRQYSKIQLKVPSDLADLYGTHVAAAHRHHLAQGFSPGGRMVVELGGLHNPSRTDYLHRYTNTFPKQQSGYWLMRGGRMYSPQLSGM